jgi:hypothetical protein
MNVWYKIQNNIPGPTFWNIPLKYTVLHHCPSILNKLTHFKAVDLRHPNGSQPRWGYLCSIWLPGSSGKLHLWYSVRPLVPPQTLQTVGDKFFCLANSIPRKYHNFQDKLRGATKDSRLYRLYWLSEYLPCTWQHTRKKLNNADWNMSIESGNFGGTDYIPLVFLSLH